MKMKEKRKSYEGKKPIQLFIIKYHQIIVIINTKTVYFQYIPHFVKR